MPASITGTVFDDLNGNGTLDPGEPGIPNAFVVLRNPNNFCTTTQTNASGNYTFSNLTIPGSYTIYETVEDPGATCPPVTFSQPTGFNSSTTPRTLTVDITQTQIDNNVAFTNRNFGHQSIETWPCSSSGLQVAGAPSATMFEINLVTGASTPLGAVTPSDPYNAIGFSALDNTIWGYRLGDVNAIVRINPDLTTDTFTVPNLPNDFLVGDIDLNGHLYLYAPNTPPGNTTFYVVDVDPNSPTYLELVDPTNGFTLDTAPFGTNLSSPANVFDWAFSPVDNQLYGIDGTSGQVIRIDPLTGAVSNLTTTGITTGVFYGAVFFDAQGFMYGINNGNGNVFRITINNGTANAVFFSSSAASSNNDGARCPLALLNLLEITKSVDPLVACPGSTITYTAVITNIGNVIDAENVIFTDPIPDGTTFLPGSVTVNGIPTTGDPSDGIPLGDIPPDGTVTVTFQVQVNTFPVPSFPITNIANVRAVNSAPIDSNEVETTQAMADLTLIKQANPTLINCDDVITYTITVTNNGPDEVTNIILTDIKPSGTDFIPNSVFIGGLQQPGADPNAGVDIGTLAPGETQIIQFKVKNVSNRCFILNTSEINYCLDQNAVSNQTITTVCCKNKKRSDCNNC